METISRASSHELEVLAGRTVDAVFQDDGYWHLFIAFRCTDGKSIVFCTEDVGIARYFEVFPVKVTIEPTECRAWRLLSEAETIREAVPLFREEWLEPSDPHPEHVGSSPHYVHHVGRGPASTNAIRKVIVQAGVKLCFDSAGSALIYASSTAPFNVEVAITQTEVEYALADFNAA